MVYAATINATILGIIEIPKSNIFLLVHTCLYDLALLQQAVRALSRKASMRLSQNPVSYNCKRH